MRMETNLPNSVHTHKVAGDNTKRNRVCPTRYQITYCCVCSLVVLVYQSSARCCGNAGRVKSKTLCVYMAFQPCYLWDFSPFHYKHVKVHCMNYGIALSQSSRGWHLCIIPVLALIFLQKENVQFL